MTAHWGSFIHTGHVESRGRRESVTQWRDAQTRPAPLFDRAGTLHVRSHIRDLVVVGTRPTTPPPCHTEA